MNAILINKPIIHIAFLGPQGSYSHNAAIKYANRCFCKIIEYSCTKFSDILKLVENQHVEYGILPLENSNSGLIDEVCNLLLNTTLILSGTITIPIKHYLLAHPQTSINHINIIYSHFQPVRQCSAFLRNFSSWKIKLCASSAVAIKKVSKINQFNTAALGSIKGGKFYGLYPILLQNLSNTPKNRTKFVILKNKNIEIINNCKSKKIMLIILTDQKSNKINIILKILKFYNINVSYLRSQLSLNTQSENVIILEIHAHLKNKYTQKALQKLRKISNFLKILGCYSTVFDNSINIELY